MIIASVEKIESTGTTTTVRGRGDGMMMTGGTGTTQKNMIGIPSGGGERTKKAAGDVGNGEELTGEGHRVRPIDMKEMRGVIQTICIVETVHGGLRRPRSTTWTVHRSRGPWLTSTGKGSGTNRLPAMFICP